jgi:hypothetical protein
VRLAVLELRIHADAPDDAADDLAAAEADYRHITYDYTLAAARTLVRLNPEMTFAYVSGAGTDSTARAERCGLA